MGRNNGFMHGIALPQPQAQPTSLAVAQPFNDVQVVAFVAAQLPGSAAERVTLAHDILAEAVVRQESLGRLIQARKQAQGA